MQSVAIGDLDCFIIFRTQLTRYDGSARIHVVFILTFDTYVRYPSHEKLAVFGGHVRRSRENIIAEKKRARRRALFTVRSRTGERASARIDGKRVRKQFPERSCLASETAFVAPVDTSALFSRSLFVLFKKASRVHPGVIHAVNRRAPRGCIFATLDTLFVAQASTSKSAIRGRRRT